MVTKTGLFLFQYPLYPLLIYMQCDHPVPRLVFSQVLVSVPSYYVPYIMHGSTFLKRHMAKWRGKTETEGGE